MTPDCVLFTTLHGFYMPSLLVTGLHLTDRSHPTRVDYAVDAYVETLGTQ